MIKYNIVQLLNMAHIGSQVLHVVLAVLPEEVVASDGFPEQTAVVLLFARGIVLTRWCHSQSAKLVFNLYFAGIMVDISKQHETA